MKKLWLFLVNTFEVNTRTSRRKMLRIANYHDARLNAAKSDPDILALYTVFHAALAIFHTMMSSLFSTEGVSKSNTQLWKKRLDEMSDNWFDAWQAMVVQVFQRSSPEFTAIFPNGKAPFQSSQYDVRMLAVQALHTTLLTYPALSAAAADVAAKLVLLNDARETQTEGFGNITFTSNMIENQRKVLANLMDDNLCALKIKYRNDISMVESFFDLAELRRSVSDSDAQFAFSGAVEAGATAAVLVPDKLVLSANAPCTFSNRSSQAELQFFFSASASAADGPIKTTVLPTESAEGTAAESGWAPGANYIIVKNVGTVTAEFDLTVTEAVVG